MSDSQTAQDQRDGPTTSSEPVSIPPNAPRSSQKASRKRTKTGCLTCRKRRIKCGEERPICNNCTKSKRNCEGYGVVFKHPAGASHLVRSDPTTSEPVPLAPSLVPGYHLPLHFPSNNSFAPWQQSNPPRQVFEQAAQHAPIRMQTYGGPGSTLPYATPFPPTVISTTSMPASNAPAWNLESASIPPHDSAIRTPLYAIPASNTLPPHFNAENSYSGSIYNPNYSSQESLYHTTDSSTDPRAQYFQQPAVDSQKSDYSDFVHGQTRFRTHSYHDPPQSSVSRQQSSSSDDWQNITPLSSNSTGTAQPPDNAYSAQIQAQIEALKQGSAFPVDEPRRYSVHGFLQRPSFDLRLPIKSEPRRQSTRIFEPDDGEDEDELNQWDVEMEIQTKSEVKLHETSQDVSMILSRHTPQDARRLRTFKAFIDSSNVLETYRPSHSSSPLTSEKTAQIFCHFVAVTGPCISIFERPASKTSAAFSSAPIPASQKALWTYTLPSMALNHPPLMHAMLALAALHLAKLQETSEGPSIKHFTYALRRVSKLIGLPKRRNEIPTLAANLLLGFYEVLLADHSKWNIHLNGARTLVMEIDFANMTRRLRRMRAQARVRISQTQSHSYEEYLRAAAIPETLIPDEDWEINEDLISALTGFQVEYDNHWQRKRNGALSDEMDLSPKDLENYKTQSDLFWWYCKQDIFQSMVSGNRLLMPYEHWIYCPPRGQIGKMDVVYATMDYLCLIVARITDFGGKDQKRKRRVISSQGGQWRPPPGFFGPPPGASGGHMSNPSGPQMPPTNPRTTSHPQSSGPPQTAGGAPMYGMIPTPDEPIQMHSAFHTMAANLNDTGYETPSPTRSVDPTIEDLEAETLAAVAEHAAIVRAFDLFERSLGPEFGELPNDATPPISTPFGPALQYRTYPIACIWAFYYVGRILIHRLHPHMPPAAMISAGVTARLTAGYAQTVGKICAGLYCAQQWGLQTGNLNPSLGAALMESTFPLFFAAVQFQDPIQRGWTISKLNDIARLTGWQTSAAVAAGCEVCWERMGATGKGPPYTPTMDRMNKDERVSGRSKWGVRVRTPEDGGPGSGSSSVVANNERLKATPAAELAKEDPAMINADRRFISVNPSARVHWALGLLAVEEDMHKLDLGKS